MNFPGVSVSTSDAADLWSERYRPQYHFTPARNWINDPNGLVYFESEYHLFYQYNPHGADWGHMSWGHAVSDDLVHWRELSVAIPEREFMIFSGCAIVDWTNASGLGDRTSPPLLAFFTAHHAEPRRETQHLAVSHDRGRTWTHHHRNPLIDLGKAHFRDPKVFWHEPTQKWVMIVALAQEHKVLLYGSTNLLDWSRLSVFGPAGATSGQWECPDLFPVGVENNTGETRWVLKVDVDDGLVAGGSGAQYFVGDFDGEVFCPDSIGGDGGARIADFGGDFYAAVTWADLPASAPGPIWIGWSSNQQTGKRYPTDPWRGCMTLPRELFLYETSVGHALGQRPIRQLRSLRGRRIDVGRLAVDDTSSLDLLQGMCAIEIEMTLSLRGAGEAGLRLRDAQGGMVDIGFDSRSNEVFVDRTRSGATFHPAFVARHTAARASSEGPAHLRIFVDHSSVEVFVDDGECVITEQIFLEQPLGVDLYAVAGGALFEDLTAWPIRSIHRR